MFCDVGNSKCCWHLERKSEGVSYSCNHYMQIINPLLFETIVTTERALSFLIQNEAIVSNSCICPVSNTKPSLVARLAVDFTPLRRKLSQCRHTKQDDAWSGGEAAALRVTLRNNHFPQIRCSLEWPESCAVRRSYNRIPAEYPAFTVVAQGGISFITSRCWSRNFRPPWSMVFIEIVVVA